MGVDLSKQSIWIADGSEVNRNIATQYVMPGGNQPKMTSVAGRTNYIQDYGIKIPATENADTYFSIWYDSPLQNNKTYTLSAIVSGLLDNSRYNFPLFAQNNSTMGVLEINHNGLCFLTFTMNYSGSITTISFEGKTLYRLFMDDISRNIASGQGPIFINNIKLEQGDKPTPWLPNINDSKYISSTVPFTENNNNNKLYIGNSWISANQFYQI